MTPAKLFVLEQERVRDLELYAYPIDKLAWTYINANRDPGEKDEHGNWKRKPAEPLPMDMFRSYRHRKDGTLAAKVTEKREWDYSLLGAQADKSEFESWGRSRTRTQFTPATTKGE